MNRFITLLLGTVLSGSVSADSQEIAPNKAGALCAAPETVYFSCRTDRAQWITLCGTSVEQLHYRFGKPERIALEYPASGRRERSAFYYAHYLRHQTDRTEVSFHNGGAEYAVFDHMDGNRRSAGVRVVTKSGKEKEFLCHGIIESRLGEVEGALPCDPDNALNLGSCAGEGR